ncbi:MAG: ankyrin repeat domain-containing protein [Bdellovibrionota bacterium]
MKIGLIALILLLLNSAFAGSCESAGISYGKDPEWAFTHASHANLRKLSDAQKGGCNFNAKAKCLNMKTRVSALSCAIIILDGEYETDVVKKFIEFQVDVNSKDADGETPLSYAIRNSSVQTIKLLMDANAEYDKLLADKLKLKIADDVSLYALTALLIKNKVNSEELNLCQYKHKVVEGMFFATRAMSDSDSKDKNLKQLSDKLYLLSSETGYNERCLYASKDSENPGSQGSLGVEANK